MLTLVAEAEAGLVDPHDQIIHRERKWFDISDGDARRTSSSRIVASRWVGHAADRLEQNCEIAGDRHVIGVALQPMDEFTVFAGQKLIHSGRLARGIVRVNEPGQAMRGIFRGSYDELHLHVPNEMIVECLGSECGETQMKPQIADRPIVDPVIERLARSLITRTRWAARLARTTLMASVLPSPLNCSVEIQARRGQIVLGCRGCPNGG